MIPAEIYIDFDYYARQKEKDFMNDQNKIVSALRLLCNQAHANALEHGFYDEHTALINHLTNNGMHQMARAAGRDFILAQLAKTSGEAGEAVDAIQRNKDDSEFAEELADIVIRVADLCGFMGIDLGTAVADKTQKNANRPYLHGKTC